LLETEKFHDMHWQQNLELHRFLISDDMKLEFDQLYEHLLDFDQ